MKNIFKTIGSAFVTYRRNRKSALRLEFILSDYCNLNCKGCTHFSPVAPREFLSVGRFEDNARHISVAVADKVSDIYLIGGEPLLYPYLKEVMVIARRYFSQQRISIFTNGLLLPKMDSDFWELCKSLEMVIAMTRYPVKFDYDAAIEICRSHGVEYSIFGDRSAHGSFFRFGLDQSRSQNPFIAHFKCFNRGCISVTADKIFPCSISACSDHLNRAFGTEFRHMPGDFIYISELKDAEQIRRLRDKPVPFCRYCVNPPSAVPYSASKRDVSEWVD